MIGWPHFDHHKDWYLCQRVCLFKKSSMNMVFHCNDIGKK
jgi:hypothetical protein